MFNELVIKSVEKFLEKNESIERHEFEQICDTIKLTTKTLEEKGKKLIDANIIKCDLSEEEETISKSNLFVEEILKRSFKVNAGENFECLLAPEDMLFIPQRIVENFREDEEPEETQKGVIFIFGDEQE